MASDTGHTAWMDAFCVQSSGAIGSLLTSTIVETHFSLSLVPSVCRGSTVLGVFRWRSMLVGCRGGVASAFIFLLEVHWSSGEYLPMRSSHFFHCCVHVGLRKQLPLLRFEGGARRQPGSLCKRPRSRAQYCFVAWFLCVFPDNVGVCDSVRTLLQKSTSPSLLCLNGLANALMNVHESHYRRRLGMRARSVPITTRSEVLSFRVTFGDTSIASAITTATSPEFEDA